MLILLLVAILNPIAYYRRRRRTKINGTIEGVETADKTSTSRETVILLELDKNKPADPSNELVQYL